MSRIAFSRFPIISLSAVALLAAACTTDKTVVVEKPQPEHASLARNLEMVDKDGRHYGTVEMDPLGGGKVLDSRWPGSGHYRSAFNEITSFEINGLNTGQTPPVDSGHLRGR